MSEWVSGCAAPTKLKAKAAPRGESEESRDGAWTPLIDALCPGASLYRLIHRALFRRRLQLLRYCHRRLRFRLLPIFCRHLPW